LDYIAPGLSDEVIVKETTYGRVIRAPFVPTKANRMLLSKGATYRPKIRKMLTAMQELGQYPLPIGAKRSLFKAAQEFLKKERVDAILVTGEPFVLFKYANQLSKEFGIPWMADYRDPWSQNEARSSNFLTKVWNTHFEKSIVKNATYITTVSDFFKERIRELIPGPSISIFGNGYDPEAIEQALRFRQNSEELSLAFVGSIYSWHPLEQFLRVAHSFVCSGDHPLLRIKFYGTNKNEVIAEMVKSQFPELEPHIVLIPKLPNKELLEQLATDNALLLFNYYSFMGTKIYDYLGIQRKMILCFSDDPEAAELKRKYYTIDESSAPSKTMQADLIEATNSGVVVRDTKHLLSVLEELYEEFTQHHSIACHSINTEMYSRKIQVQKLAELVKTIA
jgi:hypothetical protein